jgi:hypothetical protein
MKTFKIIVGIFAALALLWLAGAWFCNTPYILVSYPELQTVGYPEGSELVWRSEGNGKSRSGVWGGAAVPDIRTHLEPKIILWGDSFVEALQVDDDKKTAQQTTRLLSEKGRTNLLAVGAGVAGQSAADYLLRIPVYEKQIGPVIAHVVVVGQMEDLFPDQASARFSKFVSKPELSIIPAAPRNPSQAKQLIYRWGVKLHANGLLSVLRNSADGFNLRFKMGPVAKHRKEAQTTPSTSELDEWFRFLACRFRQATDKPLVLVYAPTVPRLEGNCWSLEDSDAETAARMETVFSENGWIVINMQKQFVRQSNTTGLSPRGFSNTRPGSGHLNEKGHRLVAETLAEYFVSSGMGASVPAPDTRHPTPENQ